MNKSNYEIIDTEAVDALWAISFREEQISSDFAVDDL